MEQALVFFDRWLSLIREHPGERPQFHTEQAAILRANVNDNAEQALAEIEAVATFMARCAGALLRRYTALFEDTVDESDSRAVGLTELLNGDLLADPLIALDDTGQPPESPLELDTLRKLAQRDTPGFRTRRRRASRRGAETSSTRKRRSTSLNEPGESMTRARTAHGTCSTRTAQAFNESYVTGSEKR